MGVMQALHDRLTGDGSWPPPAQANTWEAIELFQAFLSSDETRIRQEVSKSWRTRYMISPVPRMVSRAKANLLFGEPPKFKAANKNDQARLDYLTGRQGLAAEMHRTAIVASSEGEGWGRVVVDPSVIDVPIIEVMSRSRTIPHFQGRFVTGATFVTTWIPSQGSTERYRMLEHYTAGAVETELYRGTTTRLGHRISLGSFKPTQHRSEQPTLTGFDFPLVAFMPNAIDADPTRGYSDYQGLRDRFLAINESTTVGQQNLRLAGRKRAVIDGAGLDEHGGLSADNDVFIRTRRETGDGVDTAPLQVLDYSFDAEQTVTWIDHLIDTTLTFSGVAPQAAGRSVDGGAVSGTAMKLKMVHSLLEVAGTGAYMDAGVGRLLHAAQVLDSRRTGEGGFGRKWAEPDAPPTMVRGDGLPRDENEAAQQLTAMVGADAISLEERVAFLHPDWPEEQQIEEVKRLKAEQALPVAPSPFAGESGL